ncbi:uncharacterized protein LOC135123542 [Zophobas morio]|uniref:uncharacterized protein LOC135123542 n=1 Tax=Zophobas morio TaxID=2755281 RepID=UPI0030839B2B
MGRAVLLFLVIAFLPFVEPVSSLTVFDLSATITELTKTLFDTFLTVSDLTDIVDIDTKKEKLLFSRLDTITVQIGEISQRINQIDEKIDVISRMLKNLRKAIQLELVLHDIRSKQIYLNTYYGTMEKYIRDMEKYENSTLINFAEGVVSGNPSSVPFLMEAVYQQVIAPNFFHHFLNRFDRTDDDLFCTEKQSVAQIIHSFMNELLMMNLKSYIVTYTSYMIKKIHKIGDFNKELEDLNEEFQTRTNNLVVTIKPHMETASSELWRCDPKKHVKDETYIEVTNFLHGIILNKVNLDPNERCSEECDVFTYTTKYQCHDNKWCKHQTTCPKIINCHYIDSSMEVCRSEGMFKTNRRYDYVKFGNGRHFGRSKTCSRSRTTGLETYRNWLVYKCSYCYCLCEEGPKFFSERYINMRLTESNKTDNKVVTGLRFVKNRQVIHLQIQEGTLLPYGQIDLDTLRWVPVEDYKVTNSVYRPDVDYYTLKWEERDFDLADIMVKEGSIVTGVAFRKVGARLHLQVQATPFNFTSGKLRNAFSVLEDDPDIRRKHKFAKELILDRVDIPIRSDLPSDKFTTNKYVKFVNTGYDKDAGQTTVPFFDAQPLVSAIPVPLRGVGVFHKGTKDFGGFITPRIFTYNFTKHLQPIFPQDTKERLRVG